MHTLERDEHARIEGLHADREPCESGGPQCGERSLVDRVGIGFGCDLHARFEREPLPEVSEDGDQLLGREYGRRATSEEGRRDRDASP